MTYRFTESLPFLLNRADVRMGELFSRRLTERGLTVPMYRVLAAPTQEPPQSLGVLAPMVTVELSTLSRLIGTLAGNDLVSRTRREDYE